MCGNLHTQSSNSVTLPCFYSSPERSKQNAGSQIDVFLSDQNQLILGVMGVDVHLDEIKRLTPRYNVCRSHTCITHLYLWWRQQTNTSLLFLSFINSLEPMDTYMPSIQMDIFSFTLIFSQRWSIFYLKNINILLWFAGRHSLLWCWLTCSIFDVNLNKCASSQLVNFLEPVTLDFLDAEVEDVNKEEVST